MELDISMTLSFASSFLISDKQSGNLDFNCNRNAGLGVASFAGKLGAMVAPFFRNLVSNVCILSKLLKISVRSDFV